MTAIKQPRDLWVIINKVNEDDVAEAFVCTKEPAHRAIKHLATHFREVLSPDPHDFSTRAENARIWAEFMQWRDQQLLAVSQDPDREKAIENAAEQETVSWKSMRAFERGAKWADANPIGQEDQRRFRVNVSDARQTYNAWCDGDTDDKALRSVIEQLLSSIEKDHWRKIGAVVDPEPQHVETLHARIDALEKELAEAKKPNNIERQLYNALKASKELLDQLYGNIYESNYAGSRAHAHSSAEHVLTMYETGWINKT